jgi:hypothetical protein
MSESRQEEIIELLKKRVNVVLCGLMPKYNEEFKECNILSRHLRIKTGLGVNIDKVVYLPIKSRFTSNIYGNVATTHNKVKRLATASKKTVGVVSSKYPGKLYLFTFNLGSNYDHNKMIFLENLLAENGVAPFMYCSDPAVDMAVYRKDRKAVLYMVSPPAGELPSTADTTSRNVIIRIDLRKVGIASARLKMTDLFADEEAVPVTLTADNLRKGLEMEVDFPDGKIFLIEKK